MLSRSCALVLTVCKQRDDRLVPASEDRVDLGVRGIERLGRGEDGLSLVLEALGQPVDLLEQPARHFAQRPRLLVRTDTASLDCAPT